MNPDEIYTAWKNARKQVDVDAGFSDRVMKEVLQHQRPRPGERDQAVHSRRVWRAKAVAALLVVGVAAGLLRAGSVIALVFLNSTTGY